MTSYTTPLRLKILADGEESGQWGTTTNANLSTVLEAAITGVQPIVMVDATRILTTVNGSADEARNAVLVVTGTNTGIRQIRAPLSQKTYTVTNNTTGGFAITIGGVTGALVTIPNGATAQVYCTGTDFYLVSTTIPTANTAMNSTKLTGLTAGTTSGDSVEYAQLNTAISTATSTALTTEHEQLQTQTYTAFTTGGTSAAFTLTPIPAITSLVANQRFRVKFNAASTGTPTLAINGLTAANVQQYDATGALVTAKLGLNQLTDVEYNGTVFVVLDPLLQTAGDARYAKLAGLNTQVFSVANGASGNDAVNFGQALGLGQTWQTVTRLSDVTYYNTTGKPIVLMFTSSGGTATWQITVNSFLLPYGQVAGGYSATTNIIPVGASYSCSYGADTGLLIAELR